MSILAVTLRMCISRMPGIRQPRQRVGQKCPSDQVSSGEFVGAARGAAYSGPLVIEREAGDDRIGDVRLRIKRLDRYYRSSRWRQYP